MNYTQAISLGARIRDVLSTTYTVTVGNSMTGMAIAVTASTLHGSDIDDIRETILMCLPTSVTARDVSYRIDAIGTVFLVTFNVKLHNLTSG